MRWSSYSTMRLLQIAISGATKGDVRKAARALARHKAARKKRNRCATGHTD